MNSSSIVKEPPLREFQQFQNPRDPTSVNVLSAFSKYDTDRSGYITIDSLRQICDDISSPITDTEIELLMKEYEYIMTS